MRLPSRRLHTTSARARHVPADHTVIIITQRRRPKPSSAAYTAESRADLDFVLTRSAYHLSQLQGLNLNASRKLEPKQETILAIVTDCVHCGWIVMRHVILVVRL